MLYSILLLKNQKLNLLRFNPLEIGSYCNLEYHDGEELELSFNPLEIGSYCNLLGKAMPILVDMFQSP